jgi:mannose-1-phosphate guanylyltransferase/mannose-6-phosphate isomerase
MKVVILAGGCGYRLFPFSREIYPKQFLKILGDKSFLQMAVERFSYKVLFKDIVIVTGEEYIHLVKEQMKEIGYSDVNIVVEPMRKNTAPAIALAFKYCIEELKISKDEVFFVTPSDNIIDSVDEFIKKVELCEKFAKEGNLVTLGIMPTKPETGYGYIKVRECEGEGFLVDSFVEKPNIDKAREFLEKSNYFWNSGMFAFTGDTILNEFKLYNSEIYNLIESFSYEEFRDKFLDINSISLDNAIAEKSKNLKMVPLDIYWNDIGSWDSVFEYYKRDLEGNVKKGDTVEFGCENSMLISNSRMVVGIGIIDTYVIETEDVVLVVKRGETQKIKKVLEGLGGRNEVKFSRRVIKPWGAYTVISEGEGYKVKKIEVNPGQRLSLQSHNYRNEHWVVVKGLANVVVGEEESNIGVNMGVYIPNKVKHRLSNFGNEIVEIIETQQGEYTGEDDIIRYEDIYNRVGSEILG